MMLMLDSVSFLRGRGMGSASAIPRNSPEKVSIVGVVLKRGLAAIFRLVLFFTNLI